MTAAAGAAALLAGGRRIAFFASSTSSGANITAPANIIAGDIIVLADFADNGSGIPSKVIPTGFTEISSQGLTDSRGTLSYKLAAGTEGSSSITGQNGDFTNNKVMCVFRAYASSLTLGGAIGTISDGNPSGQTITASGGTAPLVVLGMYAGYANGSSGVIDPRTFTISAVAAKDDERNFNGADNEDIWLAWKIVNSGTPADVVIDMDDEGIRNCLIGCYLSVS